MIAKLGTFFEHLSVFASRVASRMLICWLFLVCCGTTRALWETADAAPQHHSLVGGRTYS
jgi:hypothetical protein